MNTKRRRPGYLMLEIVESASEPSESYMTMLASEGILRRDWESPEEVAIWADL